MALIVVVDDEFLIANLLAEVLRDEGHEVVTASHGRAALQLIRDRRPALVITDFMMPLMTGLELAQAISTDVEIADVPIILISGAQGSIGRQHGNLFAAVFDKPYDHQELVDAVSGIIGAA
ncbi:MAG: response regulator [Acidiphilium sp.]